MKIKIVTSHFGEFEYRGIVENNLTEYSTAHGYILDTYFSMDKVSDYYLEKMLQIKQRLYNCDYLLWIDTDAFIYDISRKLESLIDTEFDFDLLLTCENCVQTGTYFFKNSEYSHGIIDSIINYMMTFNCDDTMALIRLIDNSCEYNMGHGLDKIVSSQEDDNIFLQSISAARKDGNFKGLLNRIKLVSNYFFMVKHIHVYQCPVTPFIIHIPGSSKEDKFKFMQYYSDNKHLNHKNFTI